MDKIWYRNPSKSEVIGRCGGDEKNEWSRRTDKSRTLKKRREQTWNELSYMLNLTLKVSFSEFELMAMFSCFSPLSTDRLWMREEYLTSVTSSRPRTTWCRTLINQTNFINTSLFTFMMDFFLLFLIWLFNLTIYNDFARIQE